MSTSKLVTYTRLTANRSHPRNHKIDTITVHCYVGQITAKAGCDYFAETNRQCSSNYVIGYDGSIGLSVDEGDRSWCSSNAANDNRAVTIEVASDVNEPYAVTDRAYEALIELVTDICKRNNIKKLLWKGDKSLIGQTDKQNMTVHRWFANKSCPGDYLYNKHADIAERVNKKLGASETASNPELYSRDGLTFIKAKDFKIRYHDASKMSVQDKRCINAGFFANYRDKGNAIFTLPVAHLMCDINPDDIYESARTHIVPYIKEKKLRYTAWNNATQQFKGKKIATLIVPNNGKPYISDLADIPAGTKYAISGVPTVRGGDDVDYYNYVKPQGWDASCMVPAERNWIGVRGGDIWIITGRTVTPNYIYGMEFWKKVRDERFDDIICLDGGGSYMYRNGGTVKATAGGRRINNIIIF